MTAYTDDDKRRLFEVLSGISGTRGVVDPITDADTILAAVAPAIAARAVSDLMDELMNMDAAGAFGECCANPDCRACTVLQHIAVLVSARAEQGSSDE